MKFKHRLVKASTSKQPSQPVIVIGAGVIGLTAAIRLAQAGMPVEIVAKDSPLKTVSAKAAAFWTPFHVDGARDSWARQETI